MIPESTEFAETLFKGISLSLHQAKLSFSFPVNICWTQTVKKLPATQETWVQSLGWENPLVKGIATHSSLLAWRIPRTEEPGGLQSMESQRVGHD